MTMMKRSTRNPEKLCINVLFLINRLLYYSSTPKPLALTMDVAILHEEFVEGSALGHQVEMTMRMIMRMTMRMIMVMTMRMMTLIMRLATVEADNYQYDLEGS